MPKPKQTKHTRRNRFIDQGGDPFLPLSRMREIRWEEAVARSMLKREGKTKVFLRHVKFHCPGGCCMGIPVEVPSVAKKDG